MLAHIFDALTDRAPIRIGESNGTVKYRLGYGTPDADQILHTLSQLMFEYGTDPEIRRFTPSLFGMCGHDDRSCQYKAVTDFVLDKVRYVRDPLGVEYVRSPTALLREYREFGMANGDCDDQVLLTGSMLFSVGFETRPIGLNLFTREYFDHVALQTLRDDQRWVTFDSCRPSDPFGEVQPDFLAGEPASKFAQ